MMLEEELWGAAEWARLSMLQLTISVSDWVRYIRRPATRGAEDRRGQVIRHDAERDLVLIEWKSGITNWVPVTWLMPI